MELRNVEFIYIIGLLINQVEKLRDYPAGKLKTLEGKVVIALYKKLTKTVKQNFGFDDADDIFSSLNSIGESNIYADFSDIEIHYMMHLIEEDIKIRNAESTKPENFLHNLIALALSEKFSGKIGTCK